MREMPVHVLVRDFPESLPLLRATLPSLDQCGALPLKEAAQDIDSLLDHLDKLLRWRGRA